MQIRLLNRLIEVIKGQGLGLTKWNGWLWFVINKIRLGSKGAVYYASLLYRVDKIVNT